jgi:hypothetical protein
MKDRRMPPKSTPLKCARAMPSWPGKMRTDNRLEKPPIDPAEGCAAWGIRTGLPEGRRY